MAKSLLPVTWILGMFITLALADSDLSNDIIDPDTWPFLAGPSEDNEVVEPAAPEETLPNFVNLFSVDDSADDDSDSALSDMFGNIEETDGDTINEEQSNIISVESALQDQFHEDTDPTCVLLEPSNDVSGLVTQQYLDTDVNTVCHEANGDTSAVGDCWCAEGQECISEGTTETLMVYICADVAPDEGGNEGFSDGLMLGGPAEVDILMD